MRLAVVSPFVDRRHGTERALAELLERLAHREHCEIHLYSHRVEGLALSQASDTQPQETGAIIWHRVPSMPGPHLLQFLSWLFLNSFRRAWDRWINGLHFDLVLSPGINCLDADVVIVHALFHRLRELARDDQREGVRPGFLRGLHRRSYYGLLTRLEKHLYSNPKVALAAVSPRTSELLSKYFHRQDARVIPNGVDAARFSASARLALRAQARNRRNFQESDFVLLLIGNDWRVKGLETVLKAMSRLREFAIYLVVAGDNSPSAFFELARSLGISERCRFEPSREDVLDFFAAADVYVSPSREDSFGMPVAEAMACGLPAITSVFAGVSFLLHDGVDSFVLRDPHDAGTLSKVIRMLYERAELRSRMGQAAAAASLEWTWDRNAAAVWELLRATSRKGCL